MFAFYFENALAYYTAGVVAVNFKALGLAPGQIGKPRIASMDGKNISRWDTVTDGRRFGSRAACSGFTPPMLTQMPTWLPPGLPDGLLSHQKSQFG
jgi:hypothetical protein